MGGAHSSLTDNHRQALAAAPPRPSKFLKRLSNSKGQSSVVHSQIQRLLHQHFSRGDSTRWPLEHSSSCRQPARTEQTCILRHRHKRRRAPSVVEGRLLAAPSGSNSPSRAVVSAASAVLADSPASLRVHRKEAEASAHREAGSHRWRMAQKHLGSSNNSNDSNSRTTQHGVSRADNLVPD